MITVISSQANRKIGTQSMQGAIPHRGFSVIKVHNLVEFSAVPVGEREKLQQEFFLDPYQWWDHRSEKVT